ATLKAKTVNGEGQLQALVDEKKVPITKSTIRRDLQLEDSEGVDCLLNVVIFKQLTLTGIPRRKVTEVPQPSDPTSVVDETVNEEIDDSLERAATTSTSLDAEQDRGNIFKTQSKATPNESSSHGTDSSGGLRFQETMGDTVAQTRVLDLDTTKTTQEMKIEILKRRVKKLERRKRSRTHGLKRLYKGRIADIDTNEDITLVSTHDEQMFDVIKI
nr:hypothetical protein [Tanacetum cinerariifolium]